MAESESVENESENRSRKSSVSSDSSRSSHNPREHSSESEDFEDKEESSRSKPETKEKRFSKRISKETEKSKKPSNAEHPREHHSRGSNGEEAGKSRSRKNKSKTSTSVSGDESSRRDRDWNSSGAGGSEHETERQLKWQKLEPKFEPRFTLYKQNQTVLDGMKRDTAYYYEHRRKIAEAKPMVDNRPPPIFSHIYCNMKKLKIQQDRQDAIEKDNQLLLARLVNAMTTTRIDNWNNSTDIHHQNPKKQKQKQEELMQIEAENRRLFNRIDKNNRKSSVSTEAEQFHAPKQHQSQHRSRAVPKK